MDMDVGWHSLDKRKFYAYSTVGLLASRAVVYPLMLLKTRAQTAELAGQSPWGVARAIVRAEGLRGLFRGLAPMTLGVVPTQGVYMTVMEVTRAVLDPRMDPRFTPLLAGAAASLCSATLGVPIDVVTQRVQIRCAPLPARIRCPASRWWGAWTPVGRRGVVCTRRAPFCVRTA